MENEFVSYKVALELEKLGLELENVFGKYIKYEEHVYEDFRSDRDYIFNEGSPIRVSTYQGRLNEYEVFLCYAPLYQQVFNFFLNKFNIIGNVYATGSGYEWEYHYSPKRGGTKIAMSDDDGDCEFSGAYTTYEKAREDLINNMINKYGM